MQVIVCDDDTAWMIRFKAQLFAAFSEKGVIPEIVCYTDPKELIKKEDVQADVYFLDIELPQIDGIDLAVFLRKRQEAEFVFVSAYENYVLDTLKVKPIAFVRKEQMAQDLEKAIENLLSELAEKKRTILVMEGKKPVTLTIQEIMYFSSSKDYVEVHFLDGSYRVIRQKLATIEEEVRGFHFLRIHNRYIINLRQLKGVVSLGRKKQVELSDGDRLPVSKSYNGELEDRLFQWFRRSDT